MSAVKKIFLACILTLVVFATGAWQSGRGVLAESHDPNIPETPLYPDLTWNNLGSSIRDIKINVKGDAISLSGESHEAVEQFAAGLPQDVLNYYSNEQLAKSGWASYDAFDEADGVYYVFYHESGMYLSVEFLKCRDVPSNTCVIVWKSEQTDPTPAAPADASESDQLTAAGSFSKTSPANGATNLNATSIVLSWEAYSPSPDKYTYCVMDGSACGADGNWTSTYNTSITLTNLAYNKTYYWQVRAVTCVECVPKKFVYANAGDEWTFKTKLNQITIIGNAGVGGAILSYTDSTLKTVTAESTGNYLITLPLNWSGTVTPAKSGYMFSPTSASFVNLTAAQTIQNFTAAVPNVISGNAGTTGTILSYTDTTAKTATSLADGSYSFLVSNGWSGTVTPSHACFTFSPTSRSYSSVVTNQTAQNYTPTINPGSGCADVNVLIAGANKGRLGIPSKGRVTPTYPGIQNGPVEVVSTNGLPIFTSERALFGPYSTFNEVMGYPDNQLTTKYWFPWYDGKYMTTWVLVGNPSATLTAHVTITIGSGASAISYNYTIGPKDKVTPTYPGVLDGPVKVESDIPIFTSERALYGPASSFNEVMGYPDNQLTTKYWFPWYDGKYMTTWVLVGNPSASLTAHVTITIGSGAGVTYTIAPNGRIMPTYPGVLDGPVKVESDIPVFTSERALFGPYSTFNEVMGYPDNQLTTKYWFPWYDNKDMTTWVLVGNPSATLTANVTITIGSGTGVNYTIPPNGRVTPTYPGVQDGPVKVESNIPVFTSERALFGPASSFNEVMGYPDNQLTTKYWFPWYDGKDMTTWVLVGAP